MTGQGVRTGGRGVLVAGVLLLVGLLAPRLLPGDFNLELMELVVVYGVVCLSLNVMVGYLGYLPFSQIAFFGVGGYTGAILAEHLTTNLWAALGIAVLVAAIVSYVIGRLTLHLRGLYFAIVTLALAQLFGLAVTDLNSVTGGTNGLTFNGYLTLPLPGVTVQLSDFRTDYTVTLVISVVLVVLLWLLMRSGVGRVAKAVRDNEALARSLGVRATAVKLGLFMIASAVAAVAGVLYFAYFAFVSPGTFDLQSSLLLLLMIVLGGKKNFWTPIIGAALFEVIPNVVSLSDDVKWLIFGAVMVLVVTLLPDGIGGAVARLYRTIRGRPKRSDEQLGDWTRAAVTGPTNGIDRPVALAVHGVGKDYGGVRALDEVSFHLDSGGEVLGLIGPNGSGKTTMFNVISGFVRPDRGRVELSGNDISRLPPERIAGLGLVRTFQEEAAFPTLTVGECEQVARAAGGSDGVFSLARNAVRTRSGTEPVTRTTVGELSHGGQRLLAIALAFASAPSVILLDEPAAGLGPDESDAVAAMIRLASGHGVSVVLIEHHMEMVMDVCDRVVVLGLGRQLATGTPAEVTSDAAVVDAYLGSFGRAAAARPRQGVDAG
jgi:ABC-type branched-subunit amino acid transport system permease subunit/ABC-type branched-subunit amino acid transport system ATPase component